MENLVETPIYFPDLSAMIAVGEHAPVDGYVWSIRSGAIIVKTDVNRPLLPVGSNAFCVIAGARINKRLGAEFRNVGRFDYDDARLYTLSPVDLERYRDQIYRPFLSGTLRRESLRLTPAGNSKPEVTLMDGGRNELCKAEALDISDEGIRVLLSDRAGGELTRLTAFVVRIGLPDGSDPVFALGLVRSVQAVANGLTFGLRLAFERRPDGERYSKYYMSVRAALTSARVKSET